MHILITYAYMKVYAYTCIHICVYIHTHTYTHAHIHMHTCKHMQKKTYIYTYACIYACVFLLYTQTIYCASKKIRIVKNKNRTLSGSYFFSSYFSLFSPEIKFQGPTWPWLLDRGCISLQGLRLSWKGVKHALKCIFGRFCAPASSKIGTPYAQKP